MAGIRGLQGVVRKTVNDELQAIIWEPQHMDKLIPSMLFNMQDSEDLDRYQTGPCSEPSHAWFRLGSRLWAALWFSWVTTDLTKVWTNRIKEARIRTVSDPFAGETRRLRLGSVLLGSVCSSSLSSGSGGFHVNSSLFLAASWSQTSSSHLLWRNSVGI